jgi:hypothetical protein
MEGRKGEAETIISDNLFKMAARKRSDNNDDWHQDILCSPAKHFINKV